MANRYVIPVDPADRVRPPAPDMAAGLRATAAMMRSVGHHNAADEYELLAEAVSNGLIETLRRQRLRDRFRRAAEGRGVV